MGKFRFIAFNIISQNAYCFVSFWQINKYGTIFDYIKL